MKGLIMEKMIFGDIYDTDTAEYRYADGIVSY